MTDIQNLNLTEEDFQKLRKGDQRLQTAVFDRNAPFFMRLVRSRWGVSIEADAEDIVSAGFAKFFCKVLEGTVERQNLNGYLYTIIQNKCYAYTQLKSKNIIETKDILPEKIEEETSNDWLPLLNTAFNRLGEKCQKLLNYFYWEEKDHKDIAQEWGITEDASRQRKRECMKKLRELFKTLPSF